METAQAVNLFSSEQGGSIPPTPTKKGVGMSSFLLFMHILIYLWIVFCSAVLFHAFVTVIKEKKQKGVSMKKEELNGVDGVVLVDLLEHPDTTEGGVFLPKKAKDHPSTGIVIATGEYKDATKKHKSDIKKGDEVVFDKMAGRYVEIEDGRVLALRYTDILAVVERQ